MTNGSLLCRRRQAIGTGALVLLAACRAPEPAAVPDHMALIAGGAYRLGSDSPEREAGYELSPPAVRGYGWYDNWEANSHRVTLEPFLIDRAPVTQRQYAEFVAATGNRVPHIDEAAYTAQGFLVHPYEEVQPFNWRGGAPDSALLDHPVVLVDLEDARAYCAWRSSADGLALRLPSEAEWEATCRGKEARTFPWGDDWREGAAQVGSTGTAPVPAHPGGTTPEGVVDLAGNVFEWTSSRMPDGLPTLKGCSWDDAPGTCRCAFRHGRPAPSRHILIGFRCAASSRH